MQNLSTTIAEKKVMISDGAWGTRLQSKGLKAGQSPELWNIQHPDLVMEVAAEYIAAGAQLVKTNSFGGNRFKLQSFGLQQQVDEVNETAAACSRKAAGNSAYVLGSIGPTGKMLVMQEVSEEDLYVVFKEQAIALERGGADLILVETMTDLDEARIAVSAARESTDLAVACTMTFDKGLSSDYRTMMGVSPAEMAKQMTAAGAKFIGANCGNGIEQMIPIAKEIKAAAPSTPIIIHANAGMPILVDGATTFPETPEEMVVHLPALIDAGANIIGGCCGTSPEHIRHMRVSI